jgi:hypothetical protein
MEISKLYCIDCVYSFVPWDQKLFHYICAPFSKIPSYAYMCKHITAGDDVRNISPVTGPEKVKVGYPSCIENRRLNHECGPAAAHWAPKHKKDLFKALTKDY